MHRLYRQESSVIDASSSKCSCDHARLMIPSKRTPSSVISVLLTFLVTLVLRFSNTSPTVGYVFNRVQRNNCYNRNRRIPQRVKKPLGETSSTHQENREENTEFHLQNNEVEQYTVNGSVSTDGNNEDVTIKKNRKGKTKKRRRKRKTMQLMWCGRDYCKEVVRERTIGDHNQIILTGPATGQVAYVWDRSEDSFLFPDSTAKRNDEGDEEVEVDTCSVLLLVKQGDDDLMSIAADAVRNLTSRSDVHIEVLLDPTVAARLKHYHDVDGDQIHLFEAVVPTPGFGDNLRQHYSVSELEELLDPDADVMPAWTAFNRDVKGKSASDFSRSKKEQRKSGIRGEYAPDLICTLGGDGLLMHAGMIFQGPIPPILCVSGGSMGFLTPFRVTEMVDAVIIALGMVTDKAKKTTITKKSEAIDVGALNVFPPNMDAYPYEPVVDPIKVPTYEDAKLAVQTYDPNRFFSYDRNNNLSICLSIRMRLECRIMNREGVVRSRWNVLNEVVIDRGGSPYLSALECFCDNEHLTTVQADGIIFATPTGSTAYSLAAGSSVVHPAVPCILVTPICPHVLSFRSMVFPDHVVLRCYVPADARADANVAFDGKHRQELRRGDSVVIQMSPYPVPTINRKDHSADWLHSLKRNFNFNARPRQRPLL